MTDTTPETTKPECKITACACACSRKVLGWLECFSHTFFPLFIRLWMANIFFKAGLVKYSNMQNTINLFTYEYGVKGLPPVFAAYSATAVELICPVFLVLGLATRLAAIPMLVMAFVIQFATMPEYMHVEHYYWMILLTYLIVNGAGKISADYAIKRRCHAA